jgi:hypothetical protein
MSQDRAGVERNLAVCVVGEWFTLAAHDATGAMNLASTASCRTLSVPSLCGVTPVFDAAV